MTFQFRSGLPADSVQTHRVNQVKDRAWAGLFSLLCLLLALQTTAQAASLQVTAGNDHSCALLIGGTIQCWGDNTFGQLGVTGVERSKKPLTVIGIDKAIALAVGSAHSCALLDDGGVQCWGRNDSGQLGDGSKNNSAVPLQVVGVEQAVAVALGMFHSCALLANGTAQCWGSNSSGQLGDGSDISRTKPVAVSALTDAVALSTGATHSCASTADGSVYCWGFNFYGQLGVGDTIDSAEPLKIPDLSDVVTLAAGHFHNCALQADGTVYCWGRNLYGQLGDGSDVNRAAPVEVSELHRATAITAGERHSCALLADGGVQCWGDNATGQLGDGDVFGSFKPVSVVELDAATAITAGSLHSCALSSDGTASCWGYNRTGQLGDGTAMKSAHPVAVQNLGKTLQALTLSPAQAALKPGETLTIESTGTYSDGSKDTLNASLPLTSKALASGSVHSCALLADSTVRCWGANYDGQLGANQGSLGVFSIRPLAVENLNSVRALAAGGSHSCALLADSSVHCWGLNDSGQLGDGSTQKRLEPAPVTGVNQATAVAAGDAHSCALLSDGTVRCWGNNSFGQLGDGNGGAVGVFSAFPVIVNGLDNAIALAAGSSHSCALLATGAVYCWGWNSFGQLGDGNSGLDVFSRVPVAAFDLNQAIGLAALNVHSCALLSTGQVECWGRNNHGQLGDGSNTDSSVPVEVLELNNVVALDAGFNHNCALLSNATVQCWGLNKNGQLGHGKDNESSNTPASVNGLPPSAALSLGGGHSCALGIDGAVRCWGSNMAGQLGDGTTANRSQPAKVALLDPFEWNSSDPVVAAVSTNGTVSGFSVGETTITASISALSASMKLIVRNGNPIDKTPPSVNAQIDGLAGNNGWYRSTVDVRWSVVDPESSLTDISGCDPVTVTFDTLGLDLTCSATSEGGTTTQTLTIKRDTVAPVVKLKSPVDRMVIPLDAEVIANWQAADTPNGSGLAVAVGSVDSGKPLNTASVGRKTFTVIAEDTAGNQTVVRHRYSISETLALRDDDAQQFNTIPGLPSQIILQPAERGDLSLPKVFNSELFPAVAAIDGRTGKGGISLGGFKFQAGTAVLRDSGDGADNDWDFSALRLIRIALIHSHSGADTIIGSDAADKIYGGAGVDEINGGPGHDIIQGGLGHDRIYGNQGHDLLLGGVMRGDSREDADRLFGGGGRDILDGQRGDDFLRGGPDEDVFVLSDDFGHDIIADFEPRVDRIINSSQRTISKVNCDATGCTAMFDAVDGEETPPMLRVEPFHDDLQAILQALPSNQPRPY